MENITFEFIDVAGGRSEVRKWLLCIGKKIFIYTVSLVDYCFKDYYDPLVNRMTESLHQFEILGSFGDCCFTVLFFNKEDQFKKLVEQESLAKYFSDYNGKMEYKESLDFIINKFTSKHTSKNPLRVYVGSAINSVEMEDMLSSIRVAIVKDYINI